MCQNLIRGRKAWNSCNFCGSKYALMCAQLEKLAWTCVLGVRKVHVIVCNELDHVIVSACIHAHSHTSVQRVHVKCTCMSSTITKMCLWVHAYTQKCTHSCKGKTKHSTHKRIMYAWCISSPADHNVKARCALCGCLCDMCVYIYIYIHTYTCTYIYICM